MAFQNSSNQNYYIIIYFRNKKKFIFYSCLLKKPSSNAFIKHSTFSQNNVKTSNPKMYLVHVYL